jgi:hypothetical protein
MNENRNYVKLSNIYLVYNMATYNFTFLIPSSDLTSISVNQTVTNTYQVATAYANGNVVSSTTSNKVSAIITMTDIGQTDIRLSTFGMTCSFQDNNVAFDSTFTKAGTSTTSSIVSSQVGGNTLASLVGIPITFNYQLVTDANSNPYLQVTGTITTIIPIYGKYWAKNAYLGTIKSYFTAPTNGGGVETGTLNYSVSKVNPNPTNGNRNIIYTVGSTASNPSFLFQNQNNPISPTSASVNSLEIVGTRKILVSPGSNAILNQKITNKSNGNVMYKLPPIVDRYIIGPINPFE